MLVEVSMVSMLLRCFEAGIDAEAKRLVNDFQIASENVDTTIDSRDVHSIL